MEQGPYRRVRAVLATLVIAVVALGVSGVRPAPAEAADYVGVNVLRNVQTGRCLDSDFQGRVYTSPCNTAVSNQFWEPLFRGHIGGYDNVTLKNAATGRCLAYYWSGKIEMSIQCDEDPTWNSENTFYAVGSGWSNVVFAAAGPSGMMAIHSNYAGDVIPAKANYGNWQSWKFGL